MTELEKCMAGEWYDCHDKVFLEFKNKTHRLLMKYNSLPYDHKEEKRQVLKEMLGSVGTKVSIGHSFICDYGRNIHIGNNVTVNTGCTFVDCNRITIGNNVLIAPNVQIYTATHPIELNERLTPVETDEGIEYIRHTYALPVTIEDGCWIGGGVIILPGITPYAGHTLSEREITQTFGLNEVGMIKKVAGEKWREALHDFYPVYEEMHQSCPSPYEGIRELIKTLQKAGVLVALITGKGDKSCRITLEQFGMRNLFCSIKTGTEDKPNKAEAIEELLHDFRLNKDEFYYIGDAVSDVAACNKAGVTCLSAAWATTADVSGLKKANPSKVFPSIKELTLFLSIEK